jgi:Domain of unknown function (DUF222)/HNH endonuclease
MTSHPVIEALQAAHAALDSITLQDADGRMIGWAPMADMSGDELQQAVRLQAVLEGRVSGLRLHAVAAADAGGAAAEAAATDTHSWAAQAGRNRSRTWGGVWLAKLLDEKYSHTRAALAAGQISEEHASVIVRAAEKVPAGVSPQQLVDCEERLVHKASRMAPDNLRRAARRLLEPLSKELADAHEDELLREQERKAEAYADLVLGDNGDGTWTGKFVIPELQAHLLKTALERLSSPRRYFRGKGGELVEDVTVSSRPNGLSYTEAMGAAFLELLEHLPQTGHARSALTLVVHVEEQKLRDQVGAATLETGARISNDEVRRLLCEAAILPMVMSGRSLPLDLGTASRFFTKAQAIALSARYDSCAAVGCERPFAWTELHHRRPWSEGGPTDLDNAVPLCGFHHRRVHDTSYDHQWLPDGSVRFRHRWRSRWRGGADPWADHCSSDAPAGPVVTPTHAA